MSEALIEFIKDSCKAGKTHEEIRQVLSESGWQDEPISEALSKFVNRPFPVAIPKAVVFASPRLVFHNVFHFVVLYFSVYNVVALLFTFLDYNLPDGQGRMQGAYYYSYRPFGEAIRWSLASVLVCVPLTWWTSVVIARAMAETKQRIPRIRLKLIYLTMFVGSCVMLGNAMSFIYYLLSGELSIRFIVKVVVLSTLVTGAFKYYKTEVRQTEEKS